MLIRAVTLTLTIALGGCHLQASPPDEAPTGLVATAGDGRSVISFDQQSGLTYWIFYQPGTSVVAAALGTSVFRDAVSPQVVANLVNGTQYAFVMNATRDDSRAGPSSGIVTATPRLAGATWVSGAALGVAPQNVNGLAFSGTRFVAVGDSATVFAGDYNYTSTTLPGVTAWLQPTVFPAGFASNLSSVTYSGQFVALGRDGSILTSLDGVVWTLAASSHFVPSTGMNSIFFASPFYVAVGDGGKIFTSTDLATWLQPDSKTVENLYSVAFLNGRFVVTGANGTLLTSVDAATWSPQVSNTLNALRGAAFGALLSGPQYVAVGDAGTVVTSTDAVTWSPITPPLSANLDSVVFGSRFLAVGQAGAVAYSDDALTWAETTAGSDDLARVLFAPGMYIAVGAAGANVVSK